MYRPAFSVVAVNQVDVRMASKATQSLPIGPTLCEDGHTYVLDPLTGRKMCTCNLGTEMHFDPRLLHSDARKQGIVFSGNINGQPVGIDASAFYSPLIQGVPVRQDGLPPYVTSGLPGQPLTFEPAMTNHPYGLLYAGLDVNGGPIRKAATRETTGPLKVWLSEHKKNPYPTKAEKIMLAIITRMTLTQVSTWFANARRRLKKENKLYSADRDNRDDDDLEDNDHSDSQRAGNGSHSEGSDRRQTSDNDNEDIDVELSECSDTDDDNIISPGARKPGPASSSLTDVHTEPKISGTDHRLDASSNRGLNQRRPDQISHMSERLDPTGCGREPSSGLNKPKIWSISEIINGTSAPKQSEAQPSHQSPITGHQTTNFLHEYSLTTSQFSTNQTCQALSVAIPSSPKHTSPSSSSLSPSSSPASPTAFRPFTSTLGLPSFFQPRPGSAGIVSRYGQPTGYNFQFLNKNVSSSPNRSHNLVPHPGLSSKETFRELSPDPRPHEGFMSEMASSRRFQLSRRKDRPSYKASEDTRPKPETVSRTQLTTITPTSHPHHTHITPTSHPAWPLLTQQTTRPSSTDSNKTAVKCKSPVKRQSLCGPGSQIKTQADHQPGQ